MTKCSSLTSQILRREKETVSFAPKSEESQHEIVCSKCLSWFIASANLHLVERQKQKTEAT